MITRLSSRIRFDVDAGAGGGGGVAVTPSAADKAVDDILANDPAAVLDVESGDIDTIFEQPPSGWEEEAHAEIPVTPEPEPAPAVVDAPTGGEAPITIEEQLRRAKQSAADQERERRNAEARLADVLARTQPPAPAQSAAEQESPRVQRLRENLAVIIEEYGPTHPNAIYAQEALDTRIEREAEQAERQGATFKVLENGTDQLKANIHNYVASTQGKLTAEAAKEATDIFNIALRPFKLDVAAFDAIVQSGKVLSPELTDAVQGALDYCKGKFVKPDPVLAAARVDRDVRNDKRADKKDPVALGHTQPLVDTPMSYREAMKGLAGGDRDPWASGA